MPRPRVFVGSSSEEISYARAIAYQLRDIADTILWQESDVFTAGSYTIEALLKETSQSHFAIFVLSPDDLVDSRGTRSARSRDNVVFELGLFMGALGRHRTFMVLRRDPPVPLPSDLQGMNCAYYEIIQDSPRASTGPACETLRSAIRAAEMEPENSAHLPPVQNGLSITVILDGLRGCLSHPDFPQGRRLKVLMAQAGQPETEEGAEKTRELLRSIGARRLIRASGKDEMWTLRPL